MRGARALLAVVAALAALASFAAASASATNLCSEAPNGANECPAGKAYGVGQVFEATSGNAEIETEAAGTIACEESAIKFKVTELKLGVAAQGVLQAFSFGKCKLGAAGCVLAFNPLPPIVQVGTVGGGNGGFFVKENGGAEVFLEANCGLVFGFSALELVANVTGANGATIAFTQAVEGGLAGASELKVTYTTTNPKPLWVTK